MPCFAGREHKAPRFRNRNTLCHSRFVKIKSNQNWEQLVYCLLRQVAAIFYGKFSGLTYPLLRRAVYRNPASRPSLTPAAFACDRPIEQPLPSTRATRPYLPFLLLYPRLYLRYMAYLSLSLSLSIYK
jgi:hypothetical protein